MIQHVNDAQNSVRVVKEFSDDKIKSLQGQLEEVRGLKENQGEIINNQAQGSVSGELKMVEIMQQLQGCQELIKKRDIEIL